MTSQPAVKTVTVRGLNADDRLVWNRFGEVLLSLLNVALASNFRRRLWVCTPLTLSIKAMRLSCH